MIFNLAIKEDKESPSFSEVWNSKYQNGFFTMDSVDWDLFVSIFNFEIGWVETKILQFEDFG